MTKLGTRSVTLTLAVLLALSGARSGPVHAQSWTLIDMVGYGAAGAGLGFGLTVEVDCGDFVCGQTVLATLGGLALGGVGGALIGSGAQEALDRREALTPTHRSAVAVGTVFAGAALGGVTSSLLINSEGEGTFLGSDERTFGILGALRGGPGAPPGDAPRSEDRVRDAPEFLIRPTSGTPRTSNETPIPEPSTSKEEPMTTFPRTRLFRGFALLLLACVLFTGCYATVPRSPASMDDGVEGVTGVVLRDGTLVEFPDDAQVDLEDRDLVVVQEGPLRFDSSGQMLPRDREVDRYRPEEIREVLHEEFRFFRTLGTAAVAGVVFLGTIFAIECVGGCFN